MICRWKFCDIWRKTREKPDHVGHLFVLLEMAIQGTAKLQIFCAMIREKVPSAQMVNANAYFSEPPFSRKTKKGQAALATFILTTPVPWDFMSWSLCWALATTINNENMQGSLVLDLRHLLASLWFAYRPFITSRRPIVFNTGGRETKVVLQIIFDPAVALLQKSVVAHFDHYSTGSGSMTDNHAAQQERTSVTSWSFPASRSLWRELAGGQKRAINQTLSTLGSLQS